MKPGARITVAHILDHNTPEHSSWKKQKLNRAYRNEGRVKLGYPEVATGDYGEFLSWSRGIVQDGGHSKYQV